MARFGLAAAAALAARAAMAAPAADEVTSIPGWSPKPLLSKTYSGYLDVPSSQSHFHYLAYLSQNDPATDPVVWWLNGGPGCSSLEGAYFENGPLLVQPDATLAQNAYTWNNISTMVYLEGPAGVGFSYTDSPAGLVHNDTTSQRDFLEAVLSFYGKFPELLSRPMFITGESYAGVYIPMLAQAIVAHNAGGGSPQLNLQGIAVGNGCIGHEAGACSGLLEAMPFFVDTWRGHGLIAKSSYDGIQRACGAFNETSTACTNAIDVARTEVGRINVYDIYGLCVFNDTPAVGGPSAAPGWRAPVGELALPRSPALGGPLACIDGGAGIAYLNNPAAYEAYHVAPLKWAACTANASFSYTRTMGDERVQVYPDLIAAKLRVLIYNGEADACVPLADNEAWTSSMGLPLKDGWHAWMAEGDPETGSNVGGYANVYDTAGGFTFATVRGAGHMVPQTQPLAAWSMFNRFLNNLPF